ncbi:MAG: response regulator [Elusimicrobiota bacterium]|nr:response regulator [Elusimicrobiota bacterium]
MSKKILIVDDATDIVKILKIKLEQSGYEVVTAADGDEGWEKFKSEKPNLAILDIGLPKMDGDTLCELIKGEGSHSAPVIMLTGKTLMGDMEDAFKAGADVYLNKPYEIKQLMSHIEELI